VLIGSYSLITEDLSDICSAYMLRFKGEVSRISQDFPTLLQGTALEDSIFVPTIEDTLKRLSRNLRVRAPSVGNDTRTAKIALHVLRKLIQEFPALNTPKAVKILNEITNATAAADRVIACTQGSNICDGTEYIVLDLGLTAHAGVVDDIHKVGIGAKLLKAAEDLKAALEDLADAAKDVSEELIGQACTNALKAGSKYTDLPEARPDMKMALDMLKVACREEATCSRR